MQGRWRSRSRSLNPIFLNRYLRLKNHRVISVQGWDVDIFIILHSRWAATKSHWDIIMMMWSRRSWWECSTVHRCRLWCRSFTVQILKGWNWSARCIWSVRMTSRHGEITMICILSSVHVSLPIPAQPATMKKISQSVWKSKSWLQSLRRRTRLWRAIFSRVWKMSIWIRLSVTRQKV